MQAPPDAQPAVDAQRALLISCLLGGGILLLFFSVQARTDLPPELRSNTLWALVIGPFFFILGLMSFQNERIFTWWNDKLNKRAAWFGINTWQVILLLMSPAFRSDCHERGRFLEKALQSGCRASRRGSWESRWPSLGAFNGENKRSTFSKHFAMDIISYSICAVGSRHGHCTDSHSAIRR